MKSRKPKSRYKRNCRIPHEELDEEINFYYSDDNSRKVRTNRLQRQRVLPLSSQVEEEARIRKAQASQIEQAVLQLIKKDGANVDPQIVRDFGMFELTSQVIKEALKYDAINLLRSNLLSHVRSSITIVQIMFSLSIASKLDSERCRISKFVQGLPCDVMANIVQYLPDSSYLPLSVVCRSFRWAVYTRWAENAFLLASKVLKYYTLQNVMQLMPVEPDFIAGIGSLLHSLGQYESVTELICYCQDNFVLGLHNDWPNTMNTLRTLCSDSSPAVDSWEELHIRTVLEAENSIGLTQTKQQKCSETYIE